MSDIKSLIVPTHWSLDEALALVRALQPQSRQFHYHLCLGGGVLNTGRSDKDLDLYFLPLNYNNGKPNADGLVKHLDTVWGPSEAIGGADYPETEAPYIKRRKFLYGKQRIDVFVLGSPKDAKAEQQRQFDQEAEEEAETGGRFLRPRGARGRPLRTIPTANFNPAPAPGWVEEGGAFPTTTPTFYNYVVGAGTAEPAQPPAQDFVVQAAAPGTYGGIIRDDAGFWRNAPADPAPATQAPQTEPAEDAAAAQRRIINRIFGGGRDR